MAMTQAKIEAELRMAAEKRDREIIKHVAAKANAEAGIAEAQRQYGVALELLLKASGVPDAGLAPDTSDPDGDTKKPEA